MEQKSYDILVNNQTYSIRCSDGEDHVRRMEQKLRDVIGSLAPQGTQANLSALAMKVAITLADEAARQQELQESTVETVNQRLQPLLDQLDALLKKQTVPASTVAF